MVNTGVYRKVSYQSSKTTVSIPRESGRTKTNLVHDGDAGVLGRLVELHHLGRDVAGGDDVLLGADGGLDDGGVPRVGDQADDEVVLGHLGVEGRGVRDVDGDGRGALDAHDEVLGGLEGPAGCGGRQRGGSGERVSMGAGAG